MHPLRMRAAAGAAALVALGAVVGVGSYVVTRDDPAPTTTTTTTTTTTSTTLSVTALTDTVAQALLAGLPVIVTAEEAHCLATGLVTVVPPEQLRELDPAQPVTGLSEPQRDALLRAAVGCLPPASAAALLGDPSTTTVSLALPDEGG